MEHQFELFTERESCVCCGEYTVGFFAEFSHWAGIRCVRRGRFRRRTARCVSRIRWVVLVPGRGRCRCRAGGWCATWLLGGLLRVCRHRIRTIRACLAPVGCEGVRSGVHRVVKVVACPGLGAGILCAALRVAACLLCCCCGTRAKWVGAREAGRLSTIEIVSSTRPASRACCTSCSCIA